MSILIVVGFMALDIVTGIVKGFKNKNFDSAKLREGLQHKGGFVLSIVTASLVNYAQAYYDLGFNVDLVGIVNLYIIVTELTSIYENLCGICPELKNKKLSQYFTKTQKGEDENE